MRRFLLTGSATVLFVACSVVSGDRPPRPDSILTDLPRDSAAARPAERLGRADRRRVRRANRLESELRHRVEETIPFARGSVSIGPRAESLLEHVVGPLRKRPGIRIRVVGHTDDSGSRSTNELTGLRRAAAVKRYLVGRGIAADRIEIATAGASKPLCTQAVERCHARNRRAEITVTHMDTVVARPASPGVSPN